MRIAMLGLRAIGGNTSGGVERHVEELSVRMAALGHEVTVFCRAPYAPGGDCLYKNVRLVTVPAYRSKHLEAVTATLATLPRIVSGFDIVHFHATGPSLFSWVPRLFRRKTVVTVHGLDFLRAKWSAPASAVLRAGAWTAGRCPHATIVVSRTLQRYYSERGMRTFWIPNGVNIPEQRPLQRLKRFGLSERGYILSLGRLVPEKGLHLLIKAFAGLDTRLKLVIAGDSGLDGPYSRSLLRMAGGDERIIFTGPLFEEDKDEAFSNAEAFILPSLLEGMPISLLEAMSYGCPALTADIPECEEIWADFTEKTGVPLPPGHTFASGDADSLRASLGILLGNTTAPRDTALLSRDYARAHYAWDRLTGQTLDVYKHISAVHL